MMGDLSIFQTKPILQVYLKHYYNLLIKSETALYLKCKQFPVYFNYNSSTEKLWEIHGQKAKEFKKFPKEHNLLNSPSFLDLKIELANRMLHNCSFCEHSCNIDRTSKKKGFCGIINDCIVSSAFLHHGEEKPLVPSGTIFFGGCTFDCCFCQNFELSQIGKRKDSLQQYPVISPERLAEIAKNLKNASALNINYVGGDPTPHLATILSSFDYQTENICQIWNSNLYNTLEALNLLIDVIDLWLPDLKFGNSDCAQKYSGIRDYYEILTRNLKFIYNYGSKSIIIRHLVMPGHLECCTLPILKFIAKNLHHVIVNIMGQYHPSNKVSEACFPEINRKIFPHELEQACSWAEELGIEYRSVS